MKNTNGTNKMASLLSAIKSNHQYHRLGFRRWAITGWAVLLLLMGVGGLAWYGAFWYYLRLEYLPTQPTTEAPSGSESASPGTSRRTARENPITHIYASSHLAPSSANIFFVESSCSFIAVDPEPGGLRLNARQACAVYSTAVLNPERHVYVFHTCPLHGDYYNKSEEPVKRMLELGNVAVIDAWSLLKSGGWSEWLQDSPLDQLGPALESSVFRVEHVSDAIRLLLIWKFGGTYLDLDFISIRSLDDLGNDWVGAEDRNIVSNAALNAAPAGPGHAMFENFLKEFAEKFDGAHWAVNGPYLLTNVIYKVCNLTKGTDMQEVGRMKNCGFTVHTQKFFYPISYATWRNYFSEKAWPVVNSSLGPSVHAIHFWNKLSKDEVVTVGSGQPYGRLASQYCPPVYYASVPAF